MDAFQAYTTFNQGLAQGRAVGVPGHLPLKNPAGPASQAGPLHYPRLGVYFGGGSSHSWLWFVEVLERLGFWDQVFLDESDIAKGGLEGLDALAVSGGDTFAMAAALGKAGACALKNYLAAGGLYLGSCAGAYLPLNSSKKPLDLFNFVPAKITNLTRELPQANDLPEKFCTAYGCEYVFHPVREEVLLRTSLEGPFAGLGEFSAPLYGGPGLIESDPGQVLARYSGFSPKTRFLVDRDLAGHTLLGKAAVLRASLGHGRLYLFGPHFEHPGYPEANRLLARAIFWDLPQGDGGLPIPDGEHGFLSPKAGRELLLTLRREISNCRIVALGLEDHPVRWLIGKKVFEPAKFRVYLEAAWSRMRPLERLGPLASPPDEGLALSTLWREITRQLRALKRDLDRERDTSDAAAWLFKSLNKATAGFLDLYFRSALPRFKGENPGLPH